MWLHRHLRGVITFAARTYYRVVTAGETVPAEGPVLLVANHPNSLMDPALVAMLSERPVRFLARAPLFRQRAIGWLVKGTGAIPIYRPADDPQMVARNEEMFSAVHEALAASSVVGIFPEGLSHSAPSLAPVKTGAARIALGTAGKLGGSFPILPVGITFRGGKERLRSTALVLVGRPIQWDDLAHRADAPTPEVVRELTRRIQVGLSRVTVNLGAWEDFPLLEGAEAIHAAEFRRHRTPKPASEPVRWLVRMSRTARALERARKTRKDEAAALARDIVRHMRVLEVLGVSPRDLHEVPRTSVAIRWTMKNLLFFGLVAPLALVGMLVFLPPYVLVTRAEPRFDLPPERRATYTVLGGTAAFGGWTLMIAALLRELVGWQPALWALAVLPFLGFLTLRIRDRWRDAAADLERILFLRGRKDLRAQLLERQAAIAERIRRLERTSEETDMEGAG